MISESDGGTAAPSQMSAVDADNYHVLELVVCGHKTTDQGQ